VSDNVIMDVCSGLLLSVSVSSSWCMDFGDQPQSETGASSVTRLSRQPSNVSSCIRDRFNPIVGIKLVRTELISIVVVTVSITPTPSI
jgi:hypothetical protein